MNIFVGSLSFKVNDDELKSAFEAFGEVSSARVIKDKFSGRSKGFGFVEMPNDDEARAAIEGLNEKEIKGRPVAVSEAHERAERPAGGYRNE